MGVMYFDKSSSTNNTSLFDRLIDMNNLYEAFQKCKKGVRWKESVQKYEAHLFRNLAKLRRSLINGTYKQKPFYEFDICERGKPRHIKSLHISDRVLQRAFCDYVLMPELKKYLIYDNGASIKGKGIDFARKRVEIHLEKFYRKYHTNKGYVLIIDCKKYFDSIDHMEFIKFVADRIEDERVNDLLYYLIKEFGGDKGFGIGSQISQVAGVCYLTEIDNFIKNVLGKKFYGRYMDDLYIICKTKKEAKRILETLQKEFKDVKININKHKTQIYRIDKGFVYLKIRHILKRSGKIIRIPCKASIRRERRKLIKLFKMNIPLIDIENSYKSWRGNIIRFKSYKSVKKTDKIFMKGVA